MREDSHTSDCMTSPDTISDSAVRNVGPTYQQIEEVDRVSKVVLLIRMYYVRRSEGRLSTGFE